MTNSCEKGKMKILEPIVVVVVYSCERENGGRLVASVLLK
jgi:hypothetical protein